MPVVSSWKPAGRFKSARRRFPLFALLQSAVHVARRYTASLGYPTSAPDSARTRDLEQRDRNSRGIRAIEL